VQFVGRTLSRVAQLFEEKYCFREQLVKIQRFFNLYLLSMPITQSFFYSCNCLYSNLIIFLPLILHLLIESRSVFYLDVLSSLFFRDVAPMFWRSPAVWFSISIF